MPQYDYTIHCDELGFNLTRIEITNPLTGENPVEFLLKVEANHYTQRDMEQLPGAIREAVRRLEHFAAAPTPAEVDA